MNENEGFLSEQELAELRKEIEALTGSGDGGVFDNGSAADKPRPENQILNDIAEEANLSPLTIEENGSYVKVASDGMSAWLYLTVPSMGKDNYNMEELKDFLNKNGVVTGYHRSNLAAMIKKKVYEREILVAQGQPATDGKDGYFEYKFDTEQRKAPKVMENGKVDYTNMSSLQNVRKGDIVAIYHHAEEGQDGYDVKGKVLTANRVKEVPPLKSSPAISNEANPDVYVAMKDGKIELKNGRIDIQALHEINGDVTLITGRVEFFGDVIITGNVESGVMIRAGRNIEIRGTVEAVNLFAGGDIILGRGIQGAQKAKVSARGSVFADFIEHTVVVAGGVVQANTILNSRISTDAEVILTGKKGAIIGGYTHAFMGITATEVGNPAEVRTVVHVGCEKEIYTKHQSAKVTETALSDEIKEIMEELTVIYGKKKAGKISELMEDRLKSLEAKISTYKKDLEESTRERVKMEELISKGQKSEIQISGNIYRGTVIGMAQVQMPIEHSTCFMRYYQQKGMIESSVLAFSAS